MAMRLILQSFTLVAALAFCCSSTCASEVYKLGPQDQLRIKVSDLRAGVGEAYQWQAFNGEFSVDPSGRLSLPVIGEVDADGKTVEELEDAIATKLQAKAGLASRPDASVQIYKFRPFYITGVVVKPGEYEYRPQLTVIQAVSIAGGLQSTTEDSLFPVVRELVNARGSLRELFALRDSLSARLARLTAEIGGGAAVIFPEDILKRANEADVKRIMGEEILLFQSRKDGLKSQLDILQKNQTYLRQEIESLGEKNTNTKRQIDLTRQDLERVTKLVQQGLTPLPRQLEADRMVAQLEANLIDSRVAMTRAQQDISRVSRDMIQLNKSYQEGALQESNEVRAKLAEASARIQTAQELKYRSEARISSTMLVSAIGLNRPEFTITRRKAGALQTFAVQEDEFVSPGDVIKVVPKSTDLTDKSFVAEK